MDIYLILQSYSYLNTYSIEVEKLEGMRNSVKILKNI